MSEIPNTTMHTVVADGEIYSRIEAPAEAAAISEFWEQANHVEEFTFETIRGMDLTVTLDPDSIASEDDTPDGESGVFAVEVDVTVRSDLLAYDDEDATEQFEGNMGNDPFVELTIGDRLDGEIKVDFDSIEVSTDD